MEKNNISRLRSKIHVFKLLKVNHKLLLILPRCRDSEQSVATHQTMSPKLPMKDVFL